MKTVFAISQPFPNGRVMLAPGCGDGAGSMPHRRAGWLRIQYSEVYEFRIEPPARY
jgi:hypothetical protein